MTLISDSARARRPARAADRIAARAIVLSMDPCLTVNDVAAEVRVLAGADRRLIARAARRVYLDLADHPSSAAQRALEALRSDTLR